MTNLVQMFSHTSQHTELHKTILRGEEQPVVQKCQECCSLYHCPYCGPEMFKPTIKSKCLKHLQGHRRRAIRHKEFFIFKCHLKCRVAPHFHCVSCTSTFMRKDGFLKHLEMCENKKPKIMVIEVKSEECSPAPESVSTVSPAANSSEEMPVNENLVEHTYPKKITDEDTACQGPTDQESSNNEPTGEGEIVDEQVNTEKTSVDEENHHPCSMDVNVSNSAENHHHTETDVAIQTLVNEIFSGHTPVESNVPQRSRSDAQDLCPFCGLMLNRKNLQVHLRRKHPEQVSNHEKPAPAQLKTSKQQRLPLRQQQKVKEGERQILRCHAI